MTCDEGRGWTTESPRVGPSGSGPRNSGPIRAWADPAWVAFWEDSPTCLQGLADLGGSLLSANVALRRRLPPGRPFLLEALTPASAREWSDAVRSEGFRTIHLEFRDAPDGSRRFRCLVDRNGEEVGLWGEPESAGPAPLEKTRGGEERRSEAERRAMTDHLTGLANRRQIDMWLDGIAAYGGGPWSCLVIDLDDFKAVNDSAGHLAGDRALQATARALAANVREVDRAGRLGGDEFVALIATADTETVAAVAERLRRAIGEAITDAIGDRRTVGLRVPENRRGG